MKMKQFLKQVIQSLSVALFVGFPVAGWSATVSDRPLFIDAAVDHNLMFVVDDSGSMDWEILIPSRLGMSGSFSEGYLFNPGTEEGRNNGKYKTGKIIYGTYSNNHIVYSMARSRYFFYSPEYNLQYYDPSAEYEPWPSTTKRSFSDQAIGSAQLEPGFGGDSITADLTEKDELDVGSDAIPATVFMSLGVGVVEKIQPAYETYGDCGAGWRVGFLDDSKCYKGFKVKDRPKVAIPESIQGTLSCSNPSENWYSGWISSQDSYRYKDGNGAVLPSREWGFAPDGACLQRLEFKDEGDNKTKVYNALNGAGDIDDFFAAQQTNFANWFSYYRRRHQAIRAAIAQSVSGIDNMRMGVFGLNKNTRFDMAERMYKASRDGGLGDFLDDQYDLFDGGDYYGQGTPTRLALQHAGQQYGKESVRDDLACRKNFALIFTDGYANNHPSSTDAGNADGGADDPFGDSKGKNKNEDTLADIAYYYYQNLRDEDKNVVPGGELRVPAQCGTGAETAEMDCNTDHHMNTYAVTLGMKGQKYAGISHFKVSDAHDHPVPEWSSLNFDGTGAEQIDDLYHAAVNGKGEYYDAQSTTELVDALQDAMDDLKRQVGSGSNVSFNTTSLRSGGYIFSAEFTSQIWTGTIRAESIDKDGNITGERWDAAAKLNARVLEDNPRKIITVNEQGTGVDFSWANLGTNQKADLNAGGGADGALGQARLAYISGYDVSGPDGQVFRDRSSRLGPIINSSPAYVGAPNKIWPDDSKFGADPYSTFKAEKKSRTEVVYVGANDGMLHGFDAQTGDEVIAYIPGFLYSTEAGKGLNVLTNPDADYRSYVDLPLNSSDVYVDVAWRSVLIGGSRGGRPGLFALDVTDPAAFASGSASAITMWEFTDDNLGNMTEAAQIALLKWGENDYRWSAVFSNGYDAPSGKSGLFILDIANIANRKFIDLDTGKGLSPVRLVDHLDSDGNPNSDGVADRAYAGDLDGNLWVFDLTGGEDSWAAEVLYSAKIKDADGNVTAQPITAQPDIARNDFDSTLADPNLLVFFGTGKYLEAADIPQAADASDAQTQTFYGISDRGTNVNATNVALSRSDLVKREFTGGSVTVDGESVPVRKTDGEALEDWSTKFGWYVDLPGGGERVVEPPRVRGEFIVFASTIPTGGDPCGGGGSSFLTALQLDGSTDPNKAIIDVNNDGKLDGTDEGWAGVFYGDGIITSFALIDDLALTSDSGAKKSAYLTNFGGGTNATGRIGWTELVDF